jgi:thiamine-monophosphate kinase
MAARLERRPGAAEILLSAKQHLVPLASPLAPFLSRGGATALTSMIDVSDGLAKDLRTLCAESGVGAIIEEAALPVAAGAAELFGLKGRKLVDFAISSGEEYVLLGTTRAKRPPPTGRVIGRVVDARDGIALVDARGRGRPLPELGYEHSF